MSRAPERLPPTTLRVARAAPVEGVVDGPAELAAALVGGALAVVPKPVVDGKGLVDIWTPVVLALDPETDLLADLDVGVALPLTVTDWVADAAPMEKVWDVANMLFILEMSTNVIQ